MADEGGMLLSSSSSSSSLFLACLVLDWTVEVDSIRFDSMRFDADAAREEMV